MSDDLRGPTSDPPHGGRTIVFQTPAAPPGEAPPAQLVIVEGPATGAVFVLSGAACTIGRQDGCDVVLPSITVSRQHATIKRQGDFYYVVDNRSSNGVYLNGRKLPPEQDCLLHHGDLLRFGEFVLIFKHEEKLVDLIGLSTINLDADKVRKEADGFLKDTGGGQEEATPKPA
jgi:pSer/pThr/pTyr-binding forkhead associated (FHA) protein